MTPIERAAAALSESLANTGVEMDVNGERQRVHLFLAKPPIEAVRAVLQAIREPSEGMKQAGDFSCYAAYASGEYEENFAGDSLAIWQAMLDAALLEEGNAPDGR